MSENTYCSPDCSILVIEYEGILCSSPLVLPESNWFEEEDL